MSRTAAQKRGDNTLRLRRALPHVSANALCGIIGYCQQHGVDELTSRRGELRIARDRSLETTPFGPMLLEKELFGTVPHPNRKVTVVNPLAFLYCAFQRGGGFAAALLAAHSETPSSPELKWRLVLYGDEVVPGNQLQPANKRKVWVLYCSFLELMAHFHQEDAWFPLAAVPSHCLKHISAGVSQLYAVVLKQFFGDNVFDLSTGGIRLATSDGSTAIRLFAEFAMMVQDGLAHKDVWLCKGDAGTRICMLCKNLVSRKSELTDEDGTNFLVCEHALEADLELATDDDIKGTIGRLIAHKRHDSPGDFKLREQALGFTFKEHSLLLDPALEPHVRPVSQYVHDFMHGMMSNGVCSVVLFLFLKVAQESRPRGRANIWAQVNEHMGQWTWPRHVKFVAENADMFNEQRAKAYKKAESVKCSASDMLAMLPVLIYFSMLIVEPTGRCAAACLALRLLGDVLDALLCTRLHITTADTLRQRVNALLQACVDAGWSDYMIPKFHWMIHYAAHLARHGCLPTCWVHERKHKVLKRYAADIKLKDLLTYSKSVLAEVLSHQLESLCQDSALSLGFGLVNKRPASAGVASSLLTALGLPLTTSVQVGAVAHTSDSHCSISDIALFAGEEEATFNAGRIATLLQVGEEFFAAVQLWSVAAHHPQHFWVSWNMNDDDVCLIKLELVLSSVVWMQSAPGVACTLIPPQFRGLTPTSA